MENAEAIRLRRANTLFEHIAADKKKDDAVRRDQLAEHIRKQKEVLDRQEKVLEKRRTETDLAGERDRKRFLIERRKKQFAVAGGRVPTPLEQLHPASPHYRKPAPPAAQLNPPSAGGESANTTAAAAAAASAVRAQASGSTSSLHAAAAAAAALSKPTPAHTGSFPSTTTSNRLSEPDTPDVRATTTATTTHSGFKGDAYRREARALRELRTPHTPGLRAPPLSEDRAPLPNLENVRPRIDSRRRGRRKTTGTAMKGRRKSAGRGRPESGATKTERDLAIEAVFCTEGAYRQFKQKYEKPVDVGMPVETEMHEAVLIERHVPERLATKRAMYTTATRNRQRTVTFARSGGVSGGTATAITAIPPFPSTPLHASATAAATNGPLSLPPGTATATATAGGIEPGLEAFAPHFTHAVTDAVALVPDIDATDQAAAEAAYALALEAELAAIKRPKSGSGGGGGGVGAGPERKGQSSSLWASRPGTRSRLSNAYESLMVSRPPSVLANPILGGGRRMSSAPSPNAGGTDMARRASLSRQSGVVDTATTNVMMSDSLPMSRRGSLTRQEVLALAAEQMGKGRRGPSAQGERSKPTTGATVVAPAVAVGASGMGGGGGGGSVAGERSTAASAKRGSVFVASSLSAGAAEGKPPRDSVFDHAVPPIFSTAVREEDEGEAFGGSEDDEVDAAASGGGTPQPPDEENAFASLPVSDLGGGPPGARRADSAGLAVHGRRKTPRVVRSWQPISISAASECKRTIVPTALFKLPSLSCRNAAAAAAEEIHVPVLAARFWNPPI
ncbi:hypothetical protein HDU89_007270 [Geranomyces variabilis]|nr:hypothetical protein HDU89_007270 [Geranomyces variabilis]